MHTYNAMYNYTYVYVYGTCMRIYMYLPVAPSGGSRNEEMGGTHLWERKYKRNVRFVGGSGSTLKFLEFHTYQPTNINKILLAMIIDFA